MKYSFHIYHKYYALRAQEEINRIKLSLPQSIIEHFGSTAIPGVGGKGIIDLYILVPNEDLNKSAEVLKNIGYEFRPSGGIANERLFHQRTETYKDGHKQTFYVHLANFGYGDYAKVIAFRDLLRADPKLASEYSQIKYRAVAETKKFRNKKDKKEAYMNIKRPVIEKIISLIKN